MSTKGAGLVRREWLSLALVATLLLGATLFVYHEVGGNGFHLDDRDSISGCAPVRMDTPSLGAIWRAGSEACLARRPLPSMTFAIDWWRGGGEPQAFQQTNVLLHLIVSLLLLLGLWLLLRSPSSGDPLLPVVVAGLSASLWAVHPLQSQSVTYVVQRMASLATLFTLLAVLAYVLARTWPNRRSRWGWGLVCLLSILLGAISKENAWITPLVLVLAELGLVRRDWPLLLPRRRDLLWLVVPGALAAIALIDLASGEGPLSRFVAGGYALRDFTMSERILTQPRVIAFHISQLLWPAPGRFSIEHDFLVSSGLFSPWTTALTWIAVLAWIAVGAWLLWRREGRRLGFLLLFVPITLAMESSFAPLEMIFEHRMYLPSMGLVGLIGLGTLTALRSEKLASRRWSRWVPLLVVGGLTILAAWTTAQRVPEWRNSRTLYEAALRLAPGSARVHSMLALEYYRAGEKEKAQVFARYALSLQPEEPAGLEVLGLLAFDAHAYSHALSFFERALRVRGETPGLWSHHGECYLALDRVQEAVEAFRRAVELQSWSLENNWNLAVSLTRAKRCPEALAAWAKALPLTTEAAQREIVEKQQTQLRDRCPASP